jgi:hypothetical protein
MKAYQKAKNHRYPTRKLREELRLLKKMRNRKIRHSADHIQAIRETKGGRDII